MVSGLVIPANEAAPAELQDFPDFEQFQVAVDGWVERIEIPSLHICLMVNEEGRWRGKPMNSRATLLWWFHVLEARQSAVIVGDVVVVGLAKRNGLPKDVPDELRVMYDERSRFGVDYRLPRSTVWTKYDWSESSDNHTYSEAAVWAMLIAERAPVPIEVRIVSLES